MKQRIARLSPHQNAKVASIVWAVSSLIFVVPVSLVPFFTTPPEERGHGLFFGFFLFMPVVYLIMGYVFTVFASWVYNRLVKYIGGFEFEVEDRQA
jgi:uncharacterized membrane protein